MAGSGQDGGRDDARVADFDYDLPAEAIAQAPARPRDASRLMVLDRGTGDLGHHRFRDLPDLLRPDDLL
ncbi:MAG: S-adenosylmethionine:tRNA ribosyltransferase-isomerase, partial [Planctomycetota bacterium]|nr:S-adenosylmethionine:tRNA ribosyltransferase-isomerase [Planctomycetota bacterium]